MIKKIYALSLIFLVINTCALTALAQDTTIIISSAKNVYSFIKDKEKGAIVKEVKSTKFLTKIQTQLPLAEFYDNNSTVTLFDYRINNKSANNYETVDSYYNSKDIFHSDTRIKYVSLALNPNSTAELTVEKTTTNPLYFTSIYFSSNYKILQKEVVVKIPRWMNVSPKEFNFDGFNIQKTITYNEKDDSDIITYKIINLPAMTDEKNSPGNSYIYPHLLFIAKEENNSSVYFTNTQNQYQWYAKLVENLNQEKEASITQQANEIIKGLKTDIEKLKAIFYWVQTNIRYIAFEDGIAGFKPDAATEVLRKKYGDCKGMANLTKTLLKAVGFDARLCWIGTNHIVYDYSMPSLAVDNHMICALMFQNKTYFLDATETYLAFNEYAERIQGRQVLIENGKGYLLNNIPMGQANMNQDIQKKYLTIVGKDLVGTVEQIWKGEEKESLLSNINATKIDELQKNLISFLSNSNQNYIIDDLHFSNLENYDKDIQANFKLNIKNGIDQFDKTYYVTLDLDKEYNNFVIDIEKRLTDLWLPYKTTIIKEVEFKIPDNYTISDKPENLIIKSSNYEFNISYEIKNDKLYYKKSIQIIDPKIKKTSFSSWNEDIKKLSQHYSETITLKPKS
jgi:hypothetical protein